MAVRRCKRRIASKLVYLAVHDVKYPRNHSLRRRLEEEGYDVVVVPVPLTGGYLLRCLKLLIAGLAEARNTRGVLLAEFSLQYAWVAWAMARACRAPLVVDWFVGLYETNVEDWHRFPPLSRRARTHAMFDALAVRLADLVITDTQIRAASLSRFSTDTPRMSLPVGAPDWAVARPFPCHQEKFRVLYYGGYIPLHGVSTILAASTLLPGGSSIEFTLLGDGELRKAAEATADGDVRCHFVPPVPEEALADIISAHDVVLGIFGESTKASTVIANKVWQGLACGKVVVTRRSDALQEISDLVGAQLVQVIPGDPKALSDALWALERQRPLDVETTMATTLADYTSSLYDLFIDELYKLTSR
jgi:glycosyltransferase involved in cell wall biosynthesis